MGPSRRKAWNPRGDEAISEQRDEPTGDVVLLDRDGVINADSPDYIRRPEDWVPLPGSLEAIAQLTRHGFRIAVCTNQAGIARGLLTPRALEAIHARMQAAVAAHDGALAGIFFCPHGPEDGCDCRKPAPGLIYRACTALACTPRRVPFVGDSARDLEAARRAGAEPVLVLTGNGERTRAQGAGADARVYPDLAAVAHALVNQRTAGVSHD